MSTLVLLRKEYGTTALWQGETRSVVTRVQYSRPPVVPGRTYILSNTFRDGTWRVVSTDGIIDIRRTSDGKPIISTVEPVIQRRVLYSQHSKEGVRIFWKQRVYVDLTDPSRKKR